MVEVNIVKGISNEALLAHIRAIHAEVKQEYGGPKMWKIWLRAVTAWAKSECAA